MPTIEKSVKQIGGRSPYYVSNTVMRTITRRNLIVGAFCLPLCATNWAYSYTTNHPKVTGEGITDLSVWAALFAFICAIGAAKTLWREIRSCLDRGIRIPATLRLFTGWRYLLLLLPLLLQIQNVENYRLADGTNVQSTLKYGTEVSPLVFLFAAITIILVNALWTLDDYAAAGTGDSSRSVGQKSGFTIGQGRLSPGAGHA